MCKKLILTICTTILFITKADDNFLRRRRKLQVDKGYKYNQGNCPNAGSTGLACPPSNLGAICDKGNKDAGSFMDCWNACKPAYCCITDTPESTNYIAPTCKTDENCAGYAYCYIVFWKLGDTIGPQTYLRMNYQNDDAFFDFNDDAQFYDKILAPMGDTFWSQVVFHHFVDVDPVLDAMQDENGNVDVNKVFDNPDYWVVNSEIVS